jgi:hypothetical protein
MHRRVRDKNETAGFKHQTDAASLELRGQSAVSLCFDRIQAQVNSEIQGR